jgi:hypothetical protein
MLAVTTANYSSVSTGSPTVVVNGDYTVLIFKGNGTYTS